MRFHCLIFVKKITKLLKRKTNSFENASEAKVGGRTKERKKH